MWSRPLNSISWEITTKKKLKKKFDGTNTQVMAWMMNKCRGRIVQGDHIMGNIFHKRGGGNKNREGIGVIEEGLTKRRKAPRTRDLLVIMSIIFLKNTIKHHNNHC